jgi:hypothetical protein
LQNQASVRKAIMPIIRKEQSGDADPVAYLRHREQVGRKPTLLLK